MGYDRKCPRDGKQHCSIVDAVEDVYSGHLEKIGISTWCQRVFFSNGRQSMTSWCASSSNLPQIDRCWGKVTHFVSWCWAYSLSNVVSAVEGWLQKSDEDPETIFLWMCFFCNNQYRIMEEAGPATSWGSLVRGKVTSPFLDKKCSRQVSKLASYFIFAPLHCS